MTITKSSFTSVIIPNFNGIKYLPFCLSSLKKQTFSNFEIIVVDNGSTDGSVEFIRKNYPKAKIIQFSNNKGFAQAVNKGIGEANGKYIALLNNDTETDPHWLEEMVKVLDKNKDIHFCASLILNYKDRNIIDSAGDGFSSWGLGYKIGHGEKMEAKYKKQRFVFGACGAAAIYRKTLFERIGFFDEDFFAYREDVDLNFRAQLAGYRCLYTPSAIVYHHGSKTATSRFINYYATKNNLNVLVKNIPLNLFLKNIHKIILAQVLRFLSRPKYFFLYLASSLKFFQELPKMLQKRKKVLELRRVSERTKSKERG